MDATEKILSNAVLYGFKLTFADNLKREKGFFVRKICQSKPRGF